MCVKHGGAQWQPQTRAGTAISSVLAQTRALKRSSEEAAPLLKAALGRAVPGDH